MRESHELRSHICLNFLMLKVIIFQDRHHIDGVKFTNVWGFVSVFCHPVLFFNHSRLVDERTVIMNYYSLGQLRGKISFTICCQ